jgi:nicotinate phosphoribosyltransferase
VSGPALVGPGSYSLVVDYYELTMAAAYVAAGMEQEASFELFVRNLPAPRSFLVAAGVEDAIDALAGWQFDGASIDYLAGLGAFDEDFLGYLRELRFTGSARAIQEGEVVFGAEPILEITAPLPQAQLVETLLINLVQLPTMVASKAARVAIACRDKTFVDFAARRTHGLEAALKAARAAYVGGAAATSLTLAGRRYGIPVAGTMAHSYVTAFDDEAEAFRTFARRFPANAVLLIDTYDTEEGARVAAGVAGELAAEGISVRGVRIDSGDLERLARSVRSILDEVGHSEMQIFASGDLDEYRIAEMVANGAPVDAFGVGTRLGTSADAPYLGLVYKLVEEGGEPKAKRSVDKADYPGTKQVFRLGDHDVLACSSELVEGGRPLLRRVMADGERLAPSDPLGVIRSRCEEAVAGLPRRLRVLRGGEAPYVVEVSDELRSLQTRLAGSDPT